MMPDKRCNTLAEQLLKAFTLAVSIGCFFYANSAYAEIAVPTLDQVVANMTKNMPQLMSMVTAFAYILGIYFVIMGVIELKHFGEMRTQMSSEHGLKKPLLQIFVGAALIYLPSSIKMGLYTLWDQPAPFAYVVTTGSAWSELFGNCFIIMQFIGVIAFIRGLVILTHLGGHGGQPGTFARGITHIIGGILCINMYDTVRMIFATLGLDTTFIGGGY
jgi:intracellular multiplication protein IcmC